MRYFDDAAGRRCRAEFSPRLMPLRDCRCAFTPLPLSHYAAFDFAIAEMPVTMPPPGFAIALRDAPGRRSAAPGAADS